jgi:hypothetical protein
MTWGLKACSIVFHSEPFHFWSFNNPNFSLSGTPQSWHLSGWFSRQSPNLRLSTPLFPTPLPKSTANTSRSICSTKCSPGRSLHKFITLLSTITSKHPKRGFLFFLNYHNLEWLGLSNYKGFSFENVLLWEIKVFLYAQLADPYTNSLHFFQQSQVGTLIFFTQ